MKKKTKYLLAIIGIVLVSSLVFVCKHLFYDVDVVFCDTKYPHILPTDSELKLKEKGVWVEEPVAVDMVERMQKNNVNDTEYITVKELERVIAKYRYKIQLTTLINSIKDPDRYLRWHFDKRVDVSHDKRYDVYIVRFYFRTNRDGEITKNSTYGLIDCYDGEMIWIEGILLNQLY